MRLYKILVVEDEKIIRKGICYGFDYQQKNCVIIAEAANGLEGVQKIKEHEPDIVITDVNMPIQDAFYMLEQTRDYMYSTIIISGINEFETAKQAIQYDVTDFLVKPLDMNKLDAALDKAIEDVAMRKLYEQQNEQQDKWLEKNIVPPLQKKDELVSAILLFIEENYHEKVTLDRLETELNYSKSVIQQRFKKAMNMTFNDYLNRYRIQQSLEFIKQGYKVYEVAVMCGYSEYKYYSKVFKKYIGSSPKEIAAIL